MSEDNKKDAYCDPINDPLAQPDSKSLEELMERYKEELMGHVSLNTLGSSINPLIKDTPPEPEQVPFLNETLNPFMGRSMSSYSIRGGTYELNTINTLANNIENLTNRVINLELQNLKLNETLENIRYEIKTLKIMLSKFIAGGKNE